MITTRFVGRLGNSMFQVAACISYARKYGYEWRVPVEGRESCIHKVFPDLPKVNAHFQGLPRNGYDPEHYNFYEWPQWGDNILLQGFFQSEKFFANVKNEVKTLFVLPHVSGYDDYCSIHIRLGDYIQHAGSFPPVTIRYVEKAMQKIQTRKYLVFSDGIEWCKENIQHLNNSYQTFEFSEGRTEAEDLSLMASCGHHIIANSSFSWWGAYLGHNPDRVVVSPSYKGFNWYGPTAGVKEPKDLIPDSWVQIEFR